ncbi:TonB-dependent receptor plug domain-containing protein [Methylomonas albis]|uniref:TonB-dependent receptor plug domain-containing protein n=1 Tax=Methylomonas albis TaxID=1854563 RepID=A0ABR9CZ18_9GAMM|nr:TonB-dependent receptor plug domain-containing protein [Methylomonas albis]MBD9356118.1 TonB-dependent receptor plug domain-containing protein [Methylomonas albis]
MTVFLFATTDQLLAEPSDTDTDNTVLMDEVNVKGKAIKSAARQTVEDTPSTSIKDVFEKNISVGVGGPTASAQKVFVNGIEETNLNVQIDGARQVNNLWHHNANLLLDPGVLKAVSVDAGVAAADAGPGALGGSLRYETKDVDDFLQPGRDYGAFLSGGFASNLDTFTKSGAAYGRYRDVEAMGYASHAEGANYTAGNSDTVQGTGANLLSALGKLAYTAEGGHRFEASAQHLSDDDIRPFRANFAAVRGLTLLSENAFKRDTANFKYSTRQPSDFYDPELRFYYNATSLSRPNPNGGFRPGYFESNIQSLGATALNRFKTPLGELSTGMDFYQDQATTDNFRDAAMVETARNLGGFAQLRSAPSEWLNLSSGVRLDSQTFEAVDRQQFDNIAASPNVSIGITPLQDLSINGSYSYVFGGIQLAEAAVFHTMPFASYANDLAAQRATNAKVGLSYSLANVKLEGEVFSTRIQNTQAYQEGDDSFIRVNGPAVKTEGFNLGMAYQQNNADFGAHYTNTEVSYDHAQIGTLAFYLGSPVGEIIKLHAAYAWPTLGIKTGVSSEIALRYRFAADSGNRDLDGYHTYNLFAQWQPHFYRGISLRAELNNLTNEDYTDRYSAGTAVGFITPLQNPGRSVLISTKLEF